MTKDIKHDLNAFNEIAKSKNRPSASLDRLSQLIELHSDAKR